MFGDSVKSEILEKDSEGGIGTESTTLNLGVAGDYKG
jgi:hypothetical protein